MSARKQVVSLSELEESRLVEITRWGPQSTTVGKPFNVQPNGDSAFWFEAYLPSNELVVFLEETELSTACDRRSITAGSTPAQLKDLISKPRLLELYLVNPPRKKKQKIGEFEVKEVADSSSA